MDGERVSTSRISKARSDNDQSRDPRSRREYQVDKVTHGNYGDASVIFVHFNTSFDCVRDKLVTSASFTSSALLPPVHQLYGRR